MKKLWQEVERKTANDFGGRQQPRSGGLWFKPGDVKINDFLIDNKTTKHKSFTITQEIWKKLSKEALFEQRLPCLMVQLGDGTEFVVVDKNDFETWFEHEEQMQ